MFLTANCVETDKVSALVHCSVLKLFRQIVYFSAYMPSIILRKCVFYFVCESGSRHFLQRQESICHLPTPHLIYGKNKPPLYTRLTNHLLFLSSGRRAWPRAGALLGCVGQRRWLPTRPVGKRALWEAPAPRQPAQGSSADSAELAVRTPLQCLSVRAGETQPVRPDQPLPAAGEDQVFIVHFYCCFPRSTWYLPEEMTLVAHTVSPFW